jgi:hypothetical protein
MIKIASKYTSMEKEEQESIIVIKVCMIAIKLLWMLRRVSDQDGGGGHGFLDRHSLLTCEKQNAASLSRWHYFLYLRFMIYI